MDIKIKIYLERAGSELRLAKGIMRLSESKKLKEGAGVNPKDTFYSSVINHCYYSIFYSAKAILLTKGVKTESPNVHKKTFEEFKKNFVNTGILDVELLKIYKKAVVRADELLGIFGEEKWKRGHYTYKTIPQANKEPAEESVKNATKFLSNVNMVVS